VRFDFGLGGELAARLVAGHDRERVSGVRDRLM
jgi:hypothetical protein